MHNGWLSDFGHLFVPRVVRYPYKKDPKRYPDLENQPYPKP